MQAIRSGMPLGLFIGLNGNRNGPKTIVICLAANPNSQRIMTARKILLNHTHAVAMFYGLRDCL